MICFIYGSRDGMGWIGLAMGHRYSKSTFGANKDFFKSFLVDHGQSNNPVKDKTHRLSLRIDIYMDLVFFFSDFQSYSVCTFFSVQNHNRSTE